MKLTELNEMFEKMNFGKNQAKNGKFAKFKVSGCHKMGRMQMKLDTYVFYSIVKKF